MDLSLSEVFLSLLSAEDQAIGNVNAAKNEAEILIRSSHESLRAKRNTVLHTTRESARALVETAGKRGDEEALNIINLGESETREITELFESNVDELMANLANEVAEEYATRVLKQKKSGTA